MGSTGGEGLEVSGFTGGGDVSIGGWVIGVNFFSEAGAAGSAGVLSSAMPGGIRAPAQSGRLVVSRLVGFASGGTRLAAHVGKVVGARPVSALSGIRPVVQSGREGWGSGSVGVSALGDSRLSDLRDFMVEVAVAPVSAGGVEMGGIGAVATRPAPVGVAPRLIGWLPVGLNPTRLGDSVCKFSSHAGG